MVGRAGIDQYPTPAISPQRVPRESIVAILDHHEPTFHFPAPADRSGRHRPGFRLQQLFDENGTVRELTIFPIARYRVGLDIDVMQPRGAVAGCFAARRDIFVGDGPGSEERPGTTKLQRQLNLTFPIGQRLKSLGYIRNGIASRCQQQCDTGERRPHPQCPPPTPAPASPAPFASWSQGK